MREKQIVTAARCLVHAFHTGRLPRSSRRLQGTHVTAVPSLRFRAPHTVTLPLGAELGLQPQWASGGRPASPSFAEVGRADRHTSRSRRPGEASCSPFAGGGSRLPPVNARGETRRTRPRNCVRLRGAGWEPGSVASWATGPPAHSLPGAPRRNPQKGSHHTQPRAGRGPPNVPRTRLLQPSEGLTNWWRPRNLKLRVRRSDTHLAPRAETQSRTRGRGAGSLAGEAAAPCPERQRRWLSRPGWRAQPFQGITEGPLLPEGWGLCRQDRTTPARGLGPGRGGWRPRVSAQAQDQRLKPRLSRTRRLQTRKGQKVPSVGCYLCDPRRHLEYSSEPGPLRRAARRAWCSRGRERPQDTRTSGQRLYGAHFEDFKP